MNNAKGYIVLVISLLFIGCGNLGLYNSKTDPLVASVESNYLHESDLSALFYSGISDSDSIIIRSKFIDDWVNNQILQYIALDDLSKNSSLIRSDIEKKVELYRRSLILYEFEKSYIESMLDTTILDDAVVKYYNTHKSSFTLSSPLIKGSVARIPVGVRQSRKLENLFLSHDEDDVSEFLEICDKNNYLSLNYVNWVDITEIAKVVPFSINKADDILSRKKFYDVEDDNWRYMLRIDEYLPSGSSVPVEREKNNIKKILLHERKIELKTLLEDSLISLAKNEGLYKVDRIN